MNLAPKFATRIAGTRTSVSRTPGATPGAGNPLSQGDAGYAEGRSAEPGSDIRDTVTERESEVLALISRGSSNKQIAQALGISPETVKSHVKHIFLKLAVSTRTEAAFRALELVMTVGRYSRGRALNPTQRRRIYFASLPAPRSHSPRNSTVPPPVIARAGSGRAS
jgi:DNA-binding CsgD family transcriptional regulator